MFLSVSEGLYPTAEKLGTQVFALAQSPGQGKIVKEFV
jgi:hypothetical protein